ncbi:histamine H2 receptor-like [Montipora foliosa]|uniref:histamine H2 receptor-like n=1 Tax=Montipora foliosa TaxID=591990 RepID=UPI0035F19F2F
MMEVQNSTTSINSTPMESTLRQPVTELALVTALYCLLIITIITGNGLILTSFVVNRKLRTVTNTLIINLSVSDALVGLVSIPSWIYIFLSAYTDKPYTVGSYLFYITVDIFIGTASILLLTSISIERCYAIVKPLRHRTLSTRAFYSLIVIPWAYASIISILQPVQFKRWKEAYTILMTATGFFIPFTIILVAYVTIFVYARSGAKPKLACHRVHKKAYYNEIRLSATVALITGLFVIAWLPLFVVTVMATYYPQSLPNPPRMTRLLEFVKFCHYGNSAINPFVYAYRNKEMIKTFRSIGLWILCKEHSLQRSLLSSPATSLRMSYTRGTYRGSPRKGHFSASNERVQREVVFMSSV